MLTDTKAHYAKPEIWGGIECTICRIGDVFRDQLELAGHYEREDDINCFASLGIKRIRYPILWERHQSMQHSPPDWGWITKQLLNLRANNLNPIAGLLHHGSGPRWTNLLDESFPQRLAEYASQVAAEFPWLQFYTPVNEPLTTARFSGLYGLWYPHHRSTRSFLKMLILQAKAVVLSMEAIRKINPNAKLVQTEDITKIHSTPFLKYQANFENERRWLTYDLLCGKVDNKHPLWEFLISHGIKKPDLLFFGEHACPPSILGLNYYVTSERWLDENIADYAPDNTGGNGIHSYADAEAARVGKMEGLNARFTEVYNRYHLPMAITECHIGCTEDEQVRWLKETWNQACDAAARGLPVTAVTAWSLLGAYDWNSLLTMNDGYYENGVFDVQTGQPKPGLLAEAIRSLALTGDFNHPLLMQDGWWHQSSYAMQ